MNCSGPQWVGGVASFDRPFEHPPIVVATNATNDIDGMANMPIGVRQITTTEFLVVVYTDTAINNVNAGVNYIAIDMQ